MKDSTERLGRTGTGMSAPFYGLRFALLFLFAPLRSRLLLQRSPKERRVGHLFLYVIFWQASKKASKQGRKQASKQAKP